MCDSGELINKSFSAVANARRTFESIHGISPTTENMRLAGCTLAMCSLTYVRARLPERAADMWKVKLAEAEAGEGSLAGLHVKTNNDMAYKEIKVRIPTPINEGG